MKKMRCIFVATMLLSVLTISCEKKQKIVSNPVDIEKDEVISEQKEAISDNEETFRRREEILSNAALWLYSWQEKLMDDISIDNNPYNIVRDESGEEYSDIREFNGVDFKFLKTYDEDSEKLGWFLLSALCYNNGEDYPDCLPFKIGDSVEKVLDIFGEKIEKAGEEQSYEWENRGGDFFIKVTAEKGSVQTVILGKKGW